MNKNNKVIGFVAILLGTFLAQLDTTIVNIASPQIAEHMNASIKTTSWITSIYALALGVLLITASKLADQFGRKKLFMIGLILFGGSSIFCALAGTIEMLIVFRAIQGIGAAILTPVVIPMAVSIFGSDKNAFISAAFGGTASFATSLGGPVGGVITQYLNWRWIFLVNIPLCVVALVIAAFFIDESYDDATSKQIDFLGIGLLSTGLFLFVFSLIKATDYGIKSPKMILLLLGSFIFLAAFFFVEKRVKAPMLNLQLFHERNFRNSTICMMFLGIALSPAMFLINFFMCNILRYTTLKAGLTICFMAVTCMIVAIVGPMLYKKVGYRIFNIISMVTFVIGNYLLSRLTVYSTQKEIIWYLIVIGLALGCGAPTLVGGSLRFLKDEVIGMASGVINMSRQIGVLLGIAIFVSILNYQMGVNFDLGKKEFVNEIHANATLDETMKTKMIDSVNKLTVQAQDSHKDEVLNQIETKKREILKNSNKSEQETIAKKFDTEKYEVSNLIDNGSSLLRKKVTNGFRFTFVSSSIFLLISIFFAVLTLPKKKSSIPSITNY